MRARFTFHKLLIVRGLFYKLQISNISWQISGFALCESLFLNNLLTCFNIQFVFTFQLSPNQIVAYKNGKSSIIIHPNKRNLTHFHQSALCPSSLCTEKVFGEPAPPWKEVALTIKFQHYAKKTIRWWR